MFKSKESAATPGEPAKPKTGFESLLTTTPVVMTIVATLLAGLSSSEMTQAQYHRSLAAQHQSKVGDQWAFFQAKRIRGTVQEMAVVQLHGMPSALSVGALQQSADRLVRDLQRGETEGKRLTEKIAVARGELGTAAEPLAKASERFLLSTQEKVKQAENVKEQIGKVLSDSEASKAFVYLSSDKLPVPGDNHAGPELDPEIKHALAEIAQRKTDKETEEAMAPIKEATLLQAINDAETKAQAYDNATKPVTKIVRQLDKPMAEEAALARSFDRSTRDLLAAVNDAGNGAGKGVEDVRRTADTIKQTADSLKTGVDEVANDYQSAVISFTARRYEREARDNQASANLYEIQVRKSSWNSDRHIKRSRLFFFGMLAAQAGVTIASLALAVRLKSVLWSLACIAGVIALVIGGYVYLSV